MNELIVAKEHSRTRLDQFLAAQIPTLTRSRIQTLIRDGHILRNALTAKASDKIRTGDKIAVSEPPPAPLTAEAEDIPLDILFEDDDLIVLDKPVGMVVHPAAGNLEHTLVNALLHHCQSLSGIGGTQRPGIVHRLDKDTSGCIVIAKNDFAHQRLSQQFANREVLKIYLALANGHLKVKSGIIENAIGRHPVHRKKMAVVETVRGRLAKTDYRVLQELPHASLIECILHTGRTHQIRVHLKHLGHPILGDALYAGSTSASLLETVQCVSDYARLPIDCPRHDFSIKRGLATVPSSLQQRREEADSLADPASDVIDSLVRSAS